jgi:hypothetical protein
MQNENTVEDENMNSNILSYDDETIIWEGGPSQWVNAGVYIWWTAVLGVLIYFHLGWSEGLINPTFINPEIDNLIMLDSILKWGLIGLESLAVLKVLHAYLSVKYEYTSITKNKIKESKGITSIFRKELYCELSDVEDIKSPPAGLLGLIGLSTLVLETQDNDQRVIIIRAIKNRESLIGKVQPIWRKLKIDRKGYF